MTTKLIQKHFFNGTREFELEDDVVNARIKGLFKDQRLSIGLSTLNPEPIVTSSHLVFHSRVKFEPVLSLFLNKPNSEQFNAFVDTLKQRILEDGNAYVGVAASTQAAGLAANIYEEPPEFKAFGQDRLKNKVQTVNAMRVEEAIQLLELYVDNEEIKPLLAALEALKTEPHSEANFSQMETAFNNLGILQGAVLTYAPYLSVLLADDPFGDE